jgi:hypothetical protein
MDDLDYEAGVEGTSFIKRGRGRPKGSKNRHPALVIPNGPREVPPGLDPMDDYRHADPLAMVSRNYAMLDWAQQALRIEMKRGIGDTSKGARVDQNDITKLLDLSNTLMRVLEGHKRALALAEELAKQKTPAELLEISIRKIEGQDLPTLQAVIRRLKEHRAKLAPITRRDEKMMTGLYRREATAADSIASLGDDE